MESSKKLPRNYLSIDSGPSGLSALHIVQEAFSRLQYDLNLDKEISPCERFDRIIGSGPGGLDAILIGRMHLPLSKAISICVKLMPLLLVESTRDNEQRRRNSKAFEEAFSEVLLDTGFAIEAPMLDPSGTKTVVCVANAANPTIPYLIRSYQVRGAPAISCTILQAACACVADEDRFLPVFIGNDHRRIALMDSTTTCGNPTRVLLREARRVDGEQVDVATIVSIGSGKGDLIGLDDGIVDELRDSMKRVIGGCEEIHRDLYMQLQKTGIYFRFNVEKDMGRSVDSILAHTLAYYEEAEISDRLDEAIRSMERPTGVNLKDINSVKIMDYSLPPRPSLVPRFIGRDDILESMNRTHFTNRSSQTGIPAITVLTGLGGSGKTQMALRFALEFETIHPEAPVYFLDASSEEKLIDSFGLIVRSLGATHRCKTYEDVLTWLAMELKTWLVILDNADDPSLRPFKFIPKSSHGNVVITTRNDTYMTLAPNSSHHLGGLTPSDATTMLLVASGYEETEENRNIAEKIAHTLGHLPLALAHAGGYLYVHKCLPSYIDMYNRSKAKFLDNIPPDLPEAYDISVATTIEMSFNRLPKAAKEVMRILSQLNAVLIAEEIISSAARVRFNLEKVCADQSILHAEILMGVFCPSGEWLESDFNDIILRCLQCSLVQQTIQGNQKFYSIHVLVQDYLLSQPDSVQGCQPNELVVRLLASSDIANNGSLVPHIKCLDVGKIVESNDFFTFIGALSSAGAHTLADTYNHQLRYNSRQIAKEIVFNGNGDLGEVIRRNNVEVANLRQVVVRVMQIFKEAKERISNQILSQTATRDYFREKILALFGGNPAEEVELSERILQERMMTMGERNLETVQAKLNVAEAYLSVGRKQEAVEHCKDALTIRTELLGCDHPDTIHAMGQLGKMYAMVDRVEEGLKLAMQALQLQRISFSNSNHPYVTLAMIQVAVCLIRQGRMEDSQNIMEQSLVVFEAADQLFSQPGDVDFESRYLDRILLFTKVARDLLGFFYSLALTLTEEGEAGSASDDLPEVAVLHNEPPNDINVDEGQAEVVDILEEELAMKMSELGDSHPETLAAMADLAACYSQIGREADAEELIMALSMTQSLL